MAFWYWTKAKWHLSSPFNIINLKAEFIPQNTFNVNIDFSIQLMQNYCYIIGYMLQFFPENLKFQLFQFCSLLTDNFCHFLLKRQLKGKAIWVSFLTCGNDILIISRCVFRYLFSYLTGHLCFKNWEKPNGKVLRSKLSFRKMAISAGEYFKNNK